MNKTFRLLLLIAAFTGSEGFAQTGLILINREKGGIQPLPRSGIISHTLVAVVENG